MAGCTVNGELDTAKFSGPLLWVGLYIAAGSLLCLLGIAFDVTMCLANGVYSFRNKYFPLNAATLTFLSVATKFTVDLNTAMPGRADQVSKLSSMVLLCVAMNHFMPSLGSMSNAGIVANASALGIVVITAIVNVCIQMGTGVIYTFLPEHAIVVLVTLVVLVLFLSTVVSIPDMRRGLKKDAGVYKMHPRTMYSPAQLEESIGVYRQIASQPSTEDNISCCERFTCSTILCSVLLGILIEAVVRSFRDGSVEFCKGSSDYKRSTILVLIIQSTTILFGTVALTYRCVVTTPRRPLHHSFDNNDKQYWKHNNQYWKHKLIRFREGPAEYYYQISIRRWWIRSRTAFRLKILMVNLLLFTQFVIIKFSMLFELILTAFSVSRTKEDMFVTKKCGQFDRRVEKGRKMKPGKLIDLIMKKHSDSMSGFHGVLAYDNDNQESKTYDEDGKEISIHSWELPIVTLASIAVKLSGVENQIRFKSLVDAVRESLAYVKFIDKVQGSPRVEAEVAEKIWWKINKDILSNDKREETSTLLKCLELLQKKDLFIHQTFHGAYKRPSALHDLCCNKVVSTIRDMGMAQGCDGTEGYPFLQLTIDNVFNWIEKTTSDILRASLTNLPMAIHKSLNESSYENIEDNFKIATLFWEKAKDDIICPLYKQCESFDVNLIPFESGGSIDGWRHRLSGKLPSNLAQTTQAEMTNNVEHQEEVEIVVVAKEVNVR